MGHGLTPAVAVVADGGAGAGLGHLARCTAIAAALRAAGVPATCHALGAASPPAIDGLAWAPLERLAGVPDVAVSVLDSYVASAGDVAALARRTTLVAVHDVGAPPPGARLLVSVGGARAAPGARVLSGLAHAPLREPYWALPPRVLRSGVERVLVVTGGGVLRDTGTELALVAQAALPGATVALVRGPLADFDTPPGVKLVDAPSTLVDELLAADLVVSAAGQTALEAAATGAPCVAIPFVDNQRGNAQALREARAAVVLEPDGDLTAALALMGPQEQRAALALRAQEAVDGRGAARIAAAVAELLA